MQSNKDIDLTIIKTKQESRKIGLMKFGAKSHMEAFYNNGEIYFNTFSYFKNLEISEDGRADKYEYLSEHYSGDGLKDISLELNNIDNKPIKISQESGLESVSIDINNKKYTHIFCMSYIDVLWTEQHRKIIDERNFAKNKDYVVLIYDIAKFSKLLSDTLIKNKWKVGYGYIKYVDRNNFSGKMGCFKKFNEYAYQNEWRLAINCGKEEKSFSLNIGSLEGIAFPPMTKEEFFSIPFKIVEQDINL